MVPFIIRNALITITALSFGFLLLTSCNKEKLLEDSSAKLNFSKDTVTFDTVFTKRGSVTKQLKLFNPHNKRLRINSIKLGRGQDSQFRMNVDGEPSPAVTDVEIGAEDSLYIFVEVTVNPNNQNNPFVITDSIVYNVNGARQKTILEAWGQNAHYHIPDQEGGENFPDFSVIDCNTTWTNDKPHIIRGFAVVDSGCTLTIQQGTRVHLDQNASLFVFSNGTLIVEGSQEEPVSFQGLRLESFFDNIPGQWGGIWLSKGSEDNRIEHAIIKNAEVGIRVDSLPPNNLTSPGLTIENSIIKNCLSSGILGLTAHIRAKNCLIFNCGGNNVQLELGGLYNFYHCTLANYGSQFIDHNESIVKLSNALETQDGITVAPLNASFYNSIIHGSEREEILVNKVDEGSVQFDYLFSHSLVKTEREISDSNFVNVIKNKRPLFENIGDEDYHLTENSPAIDSGTTNYPIIPLIQTDLDGNQRDNKPDLGVYEF